MKKKKKKKPVEINLNLKCSYCKEGKKPDYKDYKNLSRYLSDRGKILGRVRTGVCARHQRILSVSIKRARFLALLPYSPEF